MKYTATEYLNINLETQNWECRVCDRVHGSARDNYKKFMKIYKRNPQDIHRPKLNPDLYEFTFSPDPRVCTIYEFVCPGCGTMIDVEYTVPGAMPLHDFELDIDALVQRMAGQTPVSDVGEGVDVTDALRAGAHENCAEHSHGEASQ